MRICFALFYCCLGSLFAAPVPILIDSFSINSFTGTSSASGTSIDITNSSTLNFEDQSTAGDALIAIDGTSQLKFLQTSSSLYTGLLSGSGTVIKNGGGALTMTGNNAAFTGPLFLQSGVLFLRGNYGGDVTVSSGASLFYGGTVSGDVNVTGGQITTENISTLNVLGNYTQAAAATYLANLSVTGQSTLIDMTGSAAIDGNVLLDVSRGVLFNHTYTILHADLGVTGTYTLIGSYPTLGLFITYDANNVYISFAQNFQAAAMTPNEMKVSQQLDSITAPTEDESLVLGSLSTLSLSDASAALNQMTGEQFANFILATLYGDSRFSARLFNSYRDLINPCVDYCNGIHTWVSGGGGGGSQSGNDATPGFSTAHGDVSAGLHSCLNKKFLLGGAFGYEIDALHFKLSGKTHLQTAQLALYSAYQSREYYLTSDLIYGYSWSDFKRPIVFGAIDRRAHSKPHLNHGRFDIEIGLNLNGCDYRFQPFIAGSVEGYYQAKAHESGAQSLDLDISPISKWLGSNLVGFHFDIEKYARIAIDVAWKHYYGNLKMTQPTRFDSFGDSFLINGPKRGNDGGIAALYFSLPWKEMFNLYLSANGEIWKHWQAYEFNAGVNFRW